MNSKIVFPVLALFFSTVVLAEPPTTEDVRKLLVVTRAENIAEQMMNTIIDNFKAKAKGAKEEFWVELRKEIKTSELVDRVIPIYQNLLTQEDVTGLIQFYESEAGRHFVAAQPQLVSQSMKVGQAWGSQMAQKVLTRLKEKGYLKKEPAEKSTAK